MSANQRSIPLVDKMRIKKYILVADLRGKEEAEFRFVGFEVIRAMIMKSSIFCDTTPCSPLKFKVDFQQTTRRYIPEVELFRI
jgi:hypothetical protein